MHLLNIIHLLAFTLCVSAIPQVVEQVPFRKKETLEDAGRNIKHMIQTVSSGSIATVFPPDSPHAGEPFSMMEYHAPCHPLPSLTFLLLPISLTVQNIMKHPTKGVSYMLRQPIREGNGLGGKDRGGMDHARVSFIGNMTILPLSSLPPTNISTLESCYLSHHPDAISWLPGSKDSAHFSTWARMDVSDIYYVGGFGDTHFIGHIPVELVVD